MHSIVARVLAPGTLRRHEEYVQLGETLREHLRLLLPGAEDAVGKMWPGSVTWYQHRAQVDAIRGDVQGRLDLGCGLQSAHDRVVRMAHHAQFLLSLQDAAVSPSP